MEVISPINAETTLPQIGLSIPLISTSASGVQQRHRPYSKRQRLSTACNQCRKRKVRCDEQQPQCRNCSIRGETCVTTDPNEPMREVTRRRAHTVSRSLEKDFNTQVSPDYLVSHSSGSVPSKNLSNGEFGLSSPKSSVTASSPGLSFSQRENDPEVQLPGGSENPTTSDYSYDREMILNTDHTSRKRKLLGNGTLQALARYLDRHFERKGWALINSRFAFGMQYAEDGPLNGLTFGEKLPLIPSGHHLDDSLAIFNRRIHPLYPVLDLEAFKASVERLASQDLQQISQGDIPILSCLYSLLALVTDEKAGKYTTSGHSYLSAAYGLSAYVTSTPYFTSVQALLLLTLALRARNKDGAGWQTLGQAIRIAQSIGLHRRVDSGIVHTPGNKIGENVHEELSSRIWWTSYCLEKMMGLEVGRPISIRDVDCNQVKPQEGRGHNYFTHWIGLAEIQSRLIDILYHRPPAKRNANELLQDIGRIDRDLCDWVKAVEPEEIRPTSDLLCTDEELHLATFLAMHYYQTVITVHQAALMVDTETYQSKIDQYCVDSPWQARLRSSESILLNSARRIANLQIDLTDRNADSKLITMTQVMLAMMVLALNITKNSESRRNRLDAELLTAISLHAENEYTSAGQSQDFIEAVRILRSHVQRQVQTTQQLGSAIYENASKPLRFAEHNDRISSISIGNLINTSIPEESTSFFEDFPLDHPWNWLLSDDAGIPPAEYPFWNI